LELQLGLTRHNIPFTITSGIRFFEQAHIKDVAAYIKLANNPRDELSFKRVAQLLPGIGGKGADRLWKCYAETAAADGFQHDAAKISELSFPGDVPATVAPGSAIRLQACARQVPKKAAVAWAQFVATIYQLEGNEVRGNASKMIRLVLEAGYEEYLKGAYDNYKSRLDDLEQLAIFALQFASLDEFLSQVALLTSVEAEEDRPRGTDDERLRLSTIHQAKGLEFDVVFVVMLCDGLFPSARSLESKDGEEEERRLFYVAITRARNELYLSYPLIRAGYGAGGDLLQHPARFLHEIPKELLEEWNLRPYG
jgi:DNA helicase-2/ATP-dependent DNA helicase PcrA